MERLVAQPKMVEKEQIGRLNFPKEDVLPTAEAVGNRSKMLEYALELGNSVYYKVKIVFEDDRGPKKVQTTIWSLNRTYVILKHGTKLPIHRIREVHVK